MILETIALQMTPGIGCKGAAHLLDTFGDAPSIFAASAEELIGRAELHPDLVRPIVRKSAFAAAERELAYCRRHGITPLAATDPAYPALLRETPDRPTVLYVRGDPACLSARCLSIVGTRSASSYGLNLCDRLVEELAERIPGLTIVSGLAFGIDITAHRAALAFGVPTVGVLANALPDVVPAQHSGVARDLVASGGALVTECHSQSKQNGSLYPARNRIIAGLSAGCLVVESPDKGGSLITAQYADSYDRTVLAIPGRVSDKQSQGTNFLIHSRKAQLVRNADDMIEALMWDLGEDPARLRPQKPAPQLTPDEAALLGCFRSDEPLSAETLGELSGFDPGTLASSLIELEVKGVLRQLPGNRYSQV